MGLIGTNCQRWVAVMAVALLGLEATIGCLPVGEGRQTGGHAHIRFDGNGMLHWSGIRCRSRSDGAPPWFVETRAVEFKIGGDAFEDWRVVINGHPTRARASLYLQVTPGGSPTARVAFGIDDAIYRSGESTGVALEPGREDGSVVLTDVPLVEGSPFRGKRQLDRLSIEWQCDDLANSLPVRLER